MLDQQTRLVSVIAALDNASGEWRVGESVQAAIMLPAGQSRTISVPQIAVQSVEGKAVVFVRTARGFRAAAVKTGPVAGDQVTILSGLTGDERIATTNSFILKAELGKSAGEEE